MPSLQNCPICGVPLKLGNLPSHTTRVHPGVKAGGPMVDAESSPARSRTEGPRSAGKKLLYALLAIGLIVASLVLYGFAFTQPPGDGGEPPLQLGAIEVYLQPSCGCCHQYVDYLESNGFDVTAHEMADLSGVKGHYRIPSQVQSCHTAAWGSYFVEGHVPMAALHKLVQDRPAIDGLALPGMPAGSPGMGGVKGDPFVIYALESGQATVFMEV